MTDGPEDTRPATPPPDAPAPDGAPLQAGAPAEADAPAATEPAAAQGHVTLVEGAEPTESGARFPVDLPVYRGPLEGLVALAQRGEIDLAEVPVSEITAGYRRMLETADPKPEAREVADFLTMAGRLLTLKANRLLPEGAIEVEAPAEEDAPPEDDAGARLAEYRLFKEAAEALLSEAAEQGPRSFLSLVAPDVIPVERLAIPAERLAAAFRAVLERIPEADPLHLEATLFSVEEKLAGLRDMLRSRRRLRFDELFHGVRSRLEAVATFLALLELLRLGSARVDQPEPFSDITVSLVD